MLDNTLLERIENVNNIITWTDIGFDKNRGTTECIFCHAKNKGYLYDYYYKCFSSKCGVKGNKISIYQKLNNLSFYNALCSLEQIGNIDLTIQEEFISSRNKLLFEVLEAYSFELQENTEALNYLYSRGFTEEFIKSEMIGYANGKSPLKNYSININSLRRHDLIRKSREFFDNRFIFPVHNINGFLVHLTGRYWPGENKEYKYLDSSAMPNIGSCKDYLLFERYIKYYKSNKNVLYLVEGVPDSYILKQCGANVLGLMGLNKLLKQSFKLEQFDTVIAIFDNDKFEEGHPNFSNEYKSWRIVLPQLVDLQIYLGKKTEIKVAMVPDNLYIKENKVKDINDFYLYLNRDGGILLKELNNISSNLVEYFIDLNKNNLTNHRTALKLIAATSKGKNLLNSYIPLNLSPIEYALKVLVG